MARRSSKGTSAAGLDRSRGVKPKGIPICHDCRKDLDGPGLRVPIKDVVGGNWRVCAECARLNGRSSR